MSLETEFSRIATALETIALALSTGATSVAKPVEVVHAPVQVPPVAAAPVVAPVAAPAPVLAIPVAAPVAPVAAPVVPMFAMPSPVGVPFADAKALLAYVMDAYKLMGPIKGAQIQNVLTSMGVVNINDVKVDQYAAFHQGVEALKVA